MLRLETDGVVNGQMAKASNNRVHAAPPPKKKERKKQRFSSTNVSWLLDTRNDATVSDDNISTHSFLFVAKDMVGGWQGAWYFSEETAVRELVSKTGDFSFKKSSGGGIPW